MILRHMLGLQTLKSLYASHINYANLHSQINFIFRQINYGYLAKNVHQYYAMFWLRSMLKVSFLTSSGSYYRRERPITRDVMDTCDS